MLEFLILNNSNLYFNRDLLPRASEGKYFHLVPVAAREVLVKSFMFSLEKDS